MARGDYDKERPYPKLEMSPPAHECFYSLHMANYIQSLSESLSLLLASSTSSGSRYLRDSTLALPDRRGAILLLLSSVVRLRFFALRCGTPSSNSSSDRSTSCCARGRLRVFLPVFVRLCWVVPSSACCALAAAFAFFFGDLNIAKGLRHFVVFFLSVVEQRSRHRQ